MRWMGLDKCNIHFLLISVSQVAFAVPGALRPPIDKLHEFLDEIILKAPAELKRGKAVPNVRLTEVTQKRGRQRNDSALRALSAIAADVPRSSTLPNRNYAP
jgi:hypothetical protein